MKFKEWVGFQILGLMGRTYCNYCKEEGDSDTFMYFNDAPYCNFEHFKKHYGLPINDKRRK